MSSGWKTAFLVALVAYTVYDKLLLTSSHTHGTLLAPAPALRLGDIAPDFEAMTTQGPMKLHEHINGSWAVLLSHPADFTPVCTTEFSAAAWSYDDFTARSVKLLGLSANGVESHKKWLEDIDSLVPHTPALKFPIIADEDRTVSKLYNMLDKNYLDPAGIPYTVRTVFVIDPAQRIRLTVAYPATTGRNFAEILRVVDALQLSDKYKVATPANWQPGEKVIIHPMIKGPKVKELFGDDVETVYLYLRYTSDPSTKKGV
ncbi:hypothetical protein IAT38_002274 [Cryptococcus sp. DSM 104549]